MPRTFLLTADRELCDKVTPGNRVKIIGILSVREKTGTSATSAQNRGTNTTYIRVLGMQSEVNKDGSPGMGFAMPSITAEDEEKIMNLSRDPNVY